VTDDAKQPVKSPQVWVRGGGTTSGPHDKMMAEQHAAAEKRRAEEDRRHAVTRQDPLAARMHTLKLGGSSSHATVVLGLKDPKSNDIQEWMVCELMPQPKDSGGVELVLNMCCPRCIFRYNRPPEDCQFKIWQSLKPFGLDDRKQDEGGKAGTLWVNPKNPDEVVTLAGTITTNDWIQCPICTWKFKIDDSTVHTK
jgi:hypothetical protein